MNINGKRVLTIEVDYEHWRPKIEAVKRARLSQIGNILPVQDEGLDTVVLNYWGKHEDEFFNLLTMWNGQIPVVCKLCHILNRKKIVLRNQYELQNHITNYHETTNPIIGTGKCVSSDRGIQFLLDDDDTNTTQPSPIPQIPPVPSIQPPIQQMGNSELQSMIDNTLRGFDEYTFNEALLQCDQKTLERQEQIVPCTSLQQSTDQEQQKRKSRNRSKSKRSVSRSSSRCSSRSSSIDSTSSRYCVEQQQLTKEHLPQLLEKRNNLNKALEGMNVEIKKKAAEIKNKMFNGPLRKEHFIRDELLYNLLDKFIPIDSFFEDEIYQKKCKTCGIDIYTCEKPFLFEISTRSINQTCFNCAGQNVCNVVFCESCYCFSSEWKLINLKGGKNILKCSKCSPSKGFTIRLADIDLIYKKYVDYLSHEFKAGSWFRIEYLLNHHVELEPCRLKVEEMQKELNECEKQIRIIQSIEN